MDGPNMLVSFLLPAAVLLAGGVSGILVKTTGFDPTLTISLHVARKRYAWIIAGIVWVLLGVALGVSGVFWIAETWGLSWIFKSLVLAIAACFVAISFIPCVNEKRRKVHYFFAWPMVYLMPVVALDVLWETWGRLDLIVVAVFGLFLLLGATMLALERTNPKKFNSQYMQWESMYLAMWFMGLMLL